MRDGYDLPETAPGHYMPLRTDQELPKAYFPDKLPPQIDLSDEIVRACSEAMWALGRLEGLGSEVDNPGAIFSSFVYKEAEQSSQVEGTAVTVSDIYHYEINVLSAAGRDESDHEADVREARNYILALGEAVSYLQTAGLSRDSITTGLIKDLHDTLLSDGRTSEEDPYPGEFRPGHAVIEESPDNVVGKRIRFIPPKPDMVPNLMANLERFIGTPSQWPTLIDIAITHYQFETIHPFSDGNGRVGRLLVVLMLLAADLLHYPMLSLSSYIERHRNEYSDHLLAVSEQGAWDDWLLFFLRGIQEQSTEAFVRGKLLLALRHEYEARYVDAPKSVRRLAFAAFEEPYFTVSEASDTIEMVYQTANIAIERLDADGVLTEITGNQQNRVFRAEEIMEIVERPAGTLPDPTELVDIDRAWRLPER